MTIHAVIIGPTSDIAAVSDGSTYYVGQDILAPTGTAAAHLIPGGPLARTVRNARIFADVGAAGTGELVKAKIYNITDGSHYVIGSDGFDADAVFLKANVGAELSAGDQWCVELSTLAWAGDPSDIGIEGVIYIEDDAEESVLSAALIDITSNATLVNTMSGNLVTAATEADAVSDAVAALLAGAGELSDAMSDIVVISAAVTAVVADVGTNSDLLSSVSGVLVTWEAGGGVISDLLSDVSNVIITAAAAVTEADAVSDQLVSMQAGAGQISDLISDVSDLIIYAAANSDALSGVVDWVDANSGGVSGVLVDVAALGDVSGLSDQISSVASELSDMQDAAGVLSDALSDIAALQTAVVAAQSDADVNAALIAALDLDATEIVALNALLAQNPPGILSADEVAAIRSKITTKLSGDAGTAR